MDDQNNRGYIIEFITVGQAMKVTAIDPVTLREVSIVGNPKASQRELADAAIEKLKYVIAKEKDA